MSEERNRRRMVAMFVGFVAALGAALFALVLTIDLTTRPHDVSWLVFVLFATLLVLGEVQPRFWMRFGEGGEVTPGWAFAYALVLLGAPSGAVLVMAATSCFVDVRHRKGVLKVVFNVSQIAVTLSLGALVLYAGGVRAGITETDRLPIQMGLGIVVAGVVIFLVNGLLTATVISIHQGIGLVTMMRSGFLLSMAVDGALLALAPVFVIAIEFSMLMMPLLAITAFLVFHSARTALQREHEANHDPLTMLLNRRAFDDRLASALDGMTEGMHPIVLVMDLDRFKDINDRLGHPIGDRLLRSFAERLERALPAGGVAARLGGDEFAVIVAGITSIDEGRQFVRSLQTRLNTHHDLSGFPVTAAVSIGAAMAPMHGQSAPALLAAADLAMYRAKQYRSGVEFASTTDNPHDIGRVGLLADLTSAIGTDQIGAHYQPMVSLTDGRVESVEALIRWRHPSYGPIAPVDFIGMTEQTDLIGPLTQWMLELTMADMLSLGPSHPNLSVNVAARNLQDRQFASSVLAAIRQAGFPAERLEFEITERDIVTNSERSALALARLRDHGVRIAIDDFGTGYSSFLTLRDLRADRLKIDQQFTSAMIHSAADELIVTKVIEIAHALRLDVVAEGVESEAVWRRLGELGCDLAQGYAIARPMALADLERWMLKPQPVAVSIDEPLSIHSLRPAVVVS
jgi:diguanylate cyclase (GGDEF)-like protein